MDDAGLFQIYAGVDSKNVEESLRLILAELRDLADNGPTAAELRDACQYANGTQRMALESTSTQMMWAGECLLSYGKIIEPAAARDALATVTPEAIREAAQDCFTYANLAGAFVGNVKEEERVKGILDGW